MLTYSFGPKHPLNPERLRRAIAILESLDLELEWLDPGQASESDVLRVHLQPYLNAVKTLSKTPDADGMEFGIWPGDNPAFAGMYEAALAYSGGSTAASRTICDGENLAITLGGGLHHADREFTRGFCIFNDPAIACSVLRDRFSRVAYVDIDVHHGEGVQWLFERDPTVLTSSIHESGRTLFPGTGFVEETGTDFSAVNVPIVAGSSGDTWLWAFQHGIVPALSAFKPEAIVLQMGADPHFADSLGHLKVRVQDWLAAIAAVRNLGTPLVALGGGGYNLTTVPRMWTAAVHTLLGASLPDRLPEPFATDWETPLYLDPDRPCPADAGLTEAEEVVRQLERDVLPNIATP